ncbi:UNVERIFIED_CONTAM: hypothetical protein GTU68_036947 [Idotea baltica]|nr:hypothetical protein [Idotea baltica]
MILFPYTNEEIQQCKTQFYNVAQFPTVVGAIDCTHIRFIFDIPEEISLRFINRHKYYSLNTQVICDANFKITNIEARWAGSVHDMRIFDNCTIHANFENRHINGLLSDGG